MELQYCINCMGKIESYPCPCCGFDGKITIQTTYQLAPGQIIDGKYLVGNIIGQGGFGITYIGRNLALDKKIAIKEYYPRIFAYRDGTKTTEVSWPVDKATEEQKEKGISAVVDEARKMAKVDDISNIVRVIDTFRANNTAYIVMEYVEGETLKQYLSRNGVIKWQEVKEKLFPVIDAMQELHARGIVHRDISPDNIMLLPGGKVKILDLGASKDLSKIDGTPSEYVVKEGFSPLEQYAAKGASAPSTDVYALAATIIYSITGKVPPRASDRILDNDVDWEEPRLRDLPTNVVDALKKALAIKQPDRFQSMTEFKAALERNAEPPATIEPEPTDPKPIDSEPKPKKRRNVIPLVVFALLLVIIISLTTYSANNSNSLGSLNNPNNGADLVNIGWKYEYGEGVEQDVSVAMEYYNKAAELGNSDAINNIGVIYQYGKNGEQDINKAIDYYTRAAELGNSIALTNLGVLYHYDENGMRDIDKAIYYYTKSAELGNGDALNNLGVIYEYGENGEKNVTKAMEYYNKAAELDNMYAYYNLGNIYFKGEYVQQNMKLAIEYYTKAADLGHSDAAKQLKKIGK